jgi:hypothetical protein
MSEATIGLKKAQADAAEARARKAIASGREVAPSGDVDDMAKAVSEYRLDPRSLSMKGGYREKVLSAALKINPNYDSKRFASDQAFDTSGSRAAGTAAANTAMAATAAQGGLDILEEQSKKVDRSGWRSLNRALLAAQGEAGVPEVGAFEAAINTAVNEYARAINPKGVATVADKLHARQILSAADSSEAFSEKVNILRKEIERSKEAPEEVRSHQRALMGGDKPSPIPKAGSVQDGYRFKGGDPSKKENWEKV